MSQTKVAEETISNSLCSQTFFSENRALYEITWKNIVQPDRLHMTVAHAHCILDT